MLRTLSLLSFLWIGFALAELVLLFAVPGSAFHADRIPLGARVTLAAGDLAALAITLLVLGVPVGWVWQRIAERWPGAARALAVPPLWCGLFLYGATWGSFWSAGGFLNRASIDFWIVQPIQVMHWVPPLVFFGVPVVALAGALGIAYGLPRLAAALGDDAVRRVRVAAASAALACAALQVIGQSVYGDAKQLVSEPIIGVRFRLGELYRQTSLERAGAFAHLHHLATGARRSQLAQYPANRELPVVRRAQVSDADYRKGVDLDRLRPLNVVLILIESLRADQLRAYGAERAVMPHLDALAERAQIFDRAYTQASHSNYADMGPLSSHYPLRSEQTHVYPAEPAYPRVMIYDVLKSVGYRTAIFSSQNEHWGKMINYLDTGGLDRLMHAETWDGPTYVAETDTGFAAWVANTEHAGSVDDRFTVGEAIEWIGEEREHPFFVYLNLQNSHFPYVVPDDFERPFGPDAVDFRMTFNRYPKDKVPVVKALYADSLHYIDQQLARLFAALEEWGLSDRTVVIVSGDTGQAFYEHDFASHGNALYDEVMRVPLVVAVPGMPPARHETLAQHLDVPPTVAGLLAVPPHPAWQGLDLFASDLPAARDVFLTVQTPIAHQYAVVRDGHKLIYDAKLDRSFLYDLVKDPGEHMDVSAAKPEVARELSERLHTWRHLQVDYYANPLAQQGWYPPILAENPAP